MPLQVTLHRGPFTKDLIFYLVAVTFVLGCLVIGKVRPGSCGRAHAAGWLPAPCYLRVCAVAGWQQGRQLPATTARGVQWGALRLWLPHRHIPNPATGLRPLGAPTIQHNMWQMICTVVGPQTPAAPPMRRQLPARPTPPFLSAHPTPSLLPAHLHTARRPACGARR